MRNATIAFAVGALGALLLTGQVQAASMPYSENFNDQSESFAEGSQLGTGGSSTWSYADQGGGDYAREHYLYVTPSSYGTSIGVASLNFSDLGGANTNDFTMSSDFTPISVSGNSSRTQRVGFGFLSSKNTFYEYDSGTHYYYADVLFSRGSGTGYAMRIVEYDVNSSSTLVTGAFNGDMSVMGTTYVMSITGTYSPTGELTLSFTVDDPNDANAATTITTDAISSPKTGQYFGYRNRVQAGGQTVDFDNFSVDVPEPATMALLGLGAVGALLRRRRK